MDDGWSERGDYGCLHAQPHSRSLQGTALSYYKRGWNGRKLCGWRRRGRGAPGGNGGVYFNNPKIYVQPSPQPTFTPYPVFQGMDALRDILFLGLPIIPAGKLGQSLIEGNPVALMSVNGPWPSQPSAPVLFHTKDGRIFIDMQLWAEGSQMAGVTHNACWMVATNWDCNYNNTALEIVNADKEPMFQAIFKTPTSLIINGIFAYPRLILVGSDTYGFSRIPPDRSGHFAKPDPNYTKRIFKYPSWKFKGQYN